VTKAAIFSGKVLLWREAHCCAVVLLGSDCSYASCNGGGGGKEANWERKELERLLVPYQDAWQPISRRARENKQLRGCVISKATVFTLLLGQ